MVSDLDCQEKLLSLLNTSYICETAWPISIYCRIFVRPSLQLCKSFAVVVSGDSGIREGSAAELTLPINLY